MWSKIEKVLIKLCQSVDTPIALGCLLRLQYREYSQLARWSINPSDYICEDAFAMDYQIVSFSKKSPLLPVEEDTRLAAMRAAVLAEKQCTMTNSRLFSETEHLSERHYRILRRAEKIISYCLGPAPSVDDFADLCRFGPGVSSSCKSHVNIFNKTISRLDVTSKALPHALRLLEIHPELFGLSMTEVGSIEVPFSIVEHNQWACVPKTAITDRPICVEPHVNMVLQLGLGGYIRRRLKRLKIDLDTQADVNRFLASKALDYGLSTIDFSAASDTIAISFVKMLVPNDWFTLLNDLRCHYTRYDDSAYRLNAKFSSMGNGFTFELETLLFHALALAVSEQSNLCSCFGDDVILPRQYAKEFISIAEYCGLTVNTAKSYINGPFFESCGTDYFLGSNVRPYFCKIGDLNEQSIRSMANGIRHAGSRRLLGMGTDSRYKRAWHATLDLSTNLQAGPATCGDTVFWACPGDYPNLIFPTSIPGGYLSVGVEVQDDYIFKECESFLRVSKRRFRYISYWIPSRFSKVFLQTLFRNRVEKELVPGIPEAAFRNRMRSKGSSLTRVTHRTEIRFDAPLFI